MPIKSIKLDSTPAKIGLIAGCLICLACTFFFVKWCFANVIASRSSDKAVAQLAADWSPDDPQTHYTLAVLNEKTFLPADLKKSIAEYEQAAALSPNDYRVWLTLGKVRQLNGDANGAELAFQKGLELAPNYSDIHWAYGNFLLKQGENQKAFAELRTAAEGSDEYYAPLIVAAWQIFGGNIGQIKQNVGDSANVNAELAAYLARQNRPEEALPLWNALPADAKKTKFGQIGRQLYEQLIIIRKFAPALQIHNQISASDAENFKIGQIFNGGFERNVKSADAAIFDWQIGDGREPQIGVNDAEKHGGSRSLIIVFNSATGRDFRNISQTVIVEPRKTYNFSVFYKSDLKTSATLGWEIRSASDGKVLAATDAVSAGQNWTNLTAKFTADENTDAVVVALVRQNCTASLCPISGRIWFDDFSLE